MGKGNIISFVTTIILVGATITVGYLSSGFTNWDTNTWFKQEDKESKINLKSLNKTVLDDGTFREILSYELEPSDELTDLRVGVKANYKDGSDCSEVLNCNINVYNKQITLDCKKAFDKQIIVTVYSMADENIKSTIACDYSKKLETMILKNTLDFLDHDTLGNTPTYGYGENNFLKFNAEDLITATYSKYTVDSNFVYKLNENSYLDIDPYKVRDESENGKIFNPNYYQVDDTVNDHGYNCSISVMEKGGEFANLLLDKFLNNKVMPSASELWNLKKSSGAEIVGWKDFLNDLSSYTGWEYKLFGSIDCYLDNVLVKTLALPENGYCFYFDFSALDMSNYINPIENINLVKNTVIF